MFDHFDLLAPFYDRAIRFSRLERMLDFVDLPSDGLLLDAGGGTGRVAAALRPYVREVLVADLSIGMLRQARRKGLKGIITATEATMAVTITPRSLTRPTAVITESSENTMSIIAIWMRTEANDAVAAPA